MLSLHTHTHTGLLFMDPNSAVEVDAWFAEVAAVSPTPVYPPTRGWGKPRW